MPAKACRYFGVGRSSFYRWRDAYQKHGEAGLKNVKSIPENPANQTPAEIIDKVLYLRRKYHLGPIRIVWYLARYHGIEDHAIVGVIATLYGDYELLIDGCLAGDPELKRKVARADRNGRGGLPILMNAIANRKVTLSPWRQEVLARCKADHEYYEAQQEDLECIDERSGSYRVRVTVEHNRYTKTFESLSDARVWRDLMKVLRAKIKHL